MSHKEPNNVSATYPDKVEFLEERRMIMTWWCWFLKVNREDHVTLHEFAKQTCANVMRLRCARRPSKPLRYRPKLALVAKRLGGL
jgi:hypothetical protein